MSLETAFDRKLVELGESFSASPVEVQEAMLECVQRLASAFAGAELVAHSTDFACKFLADAVDRYAARKEDELRHAIEKQKR